MIYIGLDDTDIEGSPGTNKLALKLAAQLAGRYETVQIVRHQLLFDARVPYTSQNGSASMLVRDQRLGTRGQGPGVRDQESSAELSGLAEELRDTIVRWCPAGSDPGLCVATDVPSTVVEFGHRCKREIVNQQEARDAAEEAGLLLWGLGGTQDGVIGALAAVGLCAAANDGRVIYLGGATTDISEVNGPQTLPQLARLGVEEVIEQSSGRAVTSGLVDVGKKLRPNIHARRTVLYVVAAEGEGVPCWQAVKVQ